MRDKFHQWAFLILRHIKNVHFTIPKNCVFFKEAFLMQYPGPLLFGVFVLHFLEPFRVKPPKKTPPRAVQVEHHPAAHCHSSWPPCAFHAQQNRAATRAPAEVSKLLEGEGTLRFIIYSCLGWCAIGNNMQRVWKSLTSIFTDDYDAYQCKHPCFRLNST